MMLRRVAVLEIVKRPGPLGVDRLPGVVGGRPHRAAARRSRNVTGASERDGHSAQARLICPTPASRIRQNAYCVCTRAAGPVQNRGFRGAPQGCSATKKTGRNAPIQGCRPREGRLPAEGGRLRWTSLHRNPPQHGMGRARGQFHRPDPRRTMMARSTLAERMNRLEQQKARLAEEEARIRDQERKQRTRRLIETGGLVDKAGLLDLEPNALLGALIAIKAEAARPEVLARWAAEGGKVFAREAAEKGRVKEAAHRRLPQADRAGADGTAARHRAALEQGAPALGRPGRARRGVEARRRARRNRAAGARRRPAAGRRRMSARSSRRALGGRSSSA